MVGQTKDLTRGKPVRQILLFAVPLLIGNLFQQFYNMADMIIVGRTINTHALAAIGVTGAIAFLVVGFSFGLTSGFAVITAQRFGAGDKDGVRHSIASAILLSIAVAAILTFLSVSTAHTLFVLMRTPADIIDEAYQYIIVIYGGIAVTVFFNLFSGILRALGDSLTPLLFLILACIVNIILDYVFINNFHMGVAGAGWATIAAQGLSVALCFVYSLKKFPMIRLRRKDWRFDLPFMRRQLVIGLAMGGQMAIISIGTIVLQIGINQLGTDSVKAFSAAVKIDQFATQPLFSLGVALATFAAQNYGARKFDRIRESAKKCAAIVVLLSFCGCLLMVLSGESILSLFGIGGNEPNVVREATQYLNTASLFYFLLGLLFVFRNILQGLGKNTMPIMAAATEVVARVVATFTFVQWWGFWGVCFVNPVAWAGGVAILLTGYFRVMRGLRREEGMGYESVVVNYDAQGKFGSPMESVPAASVRILPEETGKRNAKTDSVRFL